MSTQTLSNVDTEYYSLVYDEKMETTILSFKKNCGDERLLEASRMITDFVAHYRNHKHITDTSLLGPISIEAQKELAEEILPVMCALPSKRMVVGLVLGTDVFASYAAKNISSSAHELHDTIFYNHIDKARKAFAAEIE
ncbi:MAG: hypothetical protein MI784_16325 [Cytophagales bacterium]|nr:hypothetical protein [Cytophagales bacterium]